MLLWAPSVKGISLVVARARHLAASLGRRSVSRVLASSAENDVASRIADVGVKARQLAVLPRVLVRVFLLLLLLVALLLFFQSVLAKELPLAALILLF